MQLGDIPLDAEAYLRAVGNWEEPDGKLNSAIEKGAEIMAQLVVSHLDLNATPAGVFEEKSPPYGLFLPLMIPWVKPRKFGPMEIECKFDWEYAQSAPNFAVLGRFPWGLSSLGQWEPVYGWPGHETDKWSTASTGDQNKLKVQCMYSKLLAKAVVFNRNQLRSSAVQQKPLASTTTLDTLSAIDGSECHNVAAALRRAHVHYWVWHMATTNEFRYRLCHRIIRDFVPSRTQKAPIQPSSQNKDEIEAYDKKVNSILTALALNQISTKDRTNLETTIEWLMKGDHQSLQIRHS